MKVGDIIFYQKDGTFYIDRIADIVTSDEGTLYELADYNWWCVTEDEVLDESDERVRNYMCMTKDTMVRLSDVRNWLNSHSWNYYESDGWSEFKPKDMIKDLCKVMLYGNN